MASATWVTANANCGEPESRGPISSVRRARWRQAQSLDIAASRMRASDAGSTGGVPAVSATASRGGEADETPTTKAAAAARSVLLFLTNFNLYLNSLQININLNNRGFSTLSETR